MDKSETIPCPKCGNRLEGLPEWIERGGSLKCPCGHEVKTAEAATSGVRAMGDAIKRALGE